MEVLSIEEQKNGSAIITLSITQEENNMLVQYSVVDILQKQIEREKNNEDNIRSTVSDPE